MTRRMFLGSPLPPPYLDLDGTKARAFVRNLPILPALSGNDLRPKIRRQFDNVYLDL